MPGVKRDSGEPLSYIGDELIVAKRDDRLGGNVRYDNLLKWISNEFLRCADTTARDLLGHDSIKTTAIKDAARPIKIASPASQTTRRSTRAGSGGGTPGMPCSEVETGIGWDGIGWDGIGALASPSVGYMQRSVSG